MRYVIHILIPLFTGCIIYLFLRPDTFISNVVSEILGKNTIDIMTKTIQSKYDNDSGVIFFLKFYLPDFLWSYSMSFSILEWSRDKELNMTKSIIICLLLIVIMEIFCGTFDVLDIVFEVIAFYVSYLQVHIQN